MLDNDTVELETQGFTLLYFAGLLEEDRKRQLFAQFPESSILNLESPLWGKLLTTHTALGVPTFQEFLLVLFSSISGKPNVGSLPVVPI
jgi:hypothetical protein